PTSPRLPYVDTLHMVTGPGRPLAGVPYQLRAQGVDARGEPAEVSVVRWRSLDTSVATVDSAGVLHPRRVGSVKVVASAGGWRQAQAHLRVVAPSSRLLLDERWTDTAMRGWVSFGEPRPSVSRASHSGAAFHTNGDGSFWSGAYTRRVFPVGAGLWVEAALS